MVGLVSSKRRWVRPPNSLGDAEIDADRLGVADVQVAVGLGREPGDDLLVFAALEVLANDVADEIAIFGRVGWSAVAVHGRLPLGALG